MQKFNSGARVAIPFSHNDSAMNSHRRHWALIGPLVTLLGALPHSAEALGSERPSEVRVAVAANFAAPMEELTGLFQKQSGHRVILSFGATGELYAQIKNGAPFDILLSADDQRATQLEREGLGVAGSTFTYAKGRLALWSRDPRRVDPKGEILKTGDFRALAVANPKTAPYGVAALETILALGLKDRLTPFLVAGKSIGQTYQFVASGNAELGFVALSQISRHGKIAEGSAWIVPPTLHAPIAQDAVLLKRGLTNAAAVELMAFLKTASARSVIQSYGYDLP